MSTTVTIAGVSYTVPNEGEGNWANNVSTLLIALATSSKVFQTGTSSFNLTSEVDFGATFGLKSAYWKSKAAAVSGTGVLRLGNTESLSWRNSAGTGDLGLVANASDEILFNGVKLLSSNSLTPIEIGYLVGVGSQVDGISDVRTLTNKTIVVANNTLTTAASGNLSATELNAALSELQGDIDGRANVNLSNLGVTSIDQNLVPNGTKTLGTIGSKWDFVYSSGLMGDLVYKTDNTISLSPGTRKLNDTTGADVLDWSSYPKVLTEKTQLSSGAASAPSGSRRDIYYNNSDNSYYYHNGTGWVQLTSGALSGSGTTGKIAKFTGLSALGDSVLIESGNSIGINVTPTTKFHIGGVSASILTLNSTTVNAPSAIEVGFGGSGSRQAYIDLVGDDTYTDYGLRIMRDGTGLNANSTISTRGTGELGLLTNEAAPIVFSTSAAERMRIAAAGTITIGATSGAAAVPTQVVMDESYASGAASVDNLKLYLYKQASTNAFGFGVGPTGDLRYWAGPSGSGGTHDFYTNSTKRMSIGSTGTITLDAYSGSGDRYLKVDSSGVVSTQPTTVPTIQLFTSGSGTYTKPAAAKYIRVRMVGGGAGGSGSGLNGAGANVGGAGGDTGFGAAWTAYGGSSYTLSAGGGGGSYQFLAGAGIACQGNGGNACGNYVSGANTYSQGGSGGGSVLGGGGSSVLFTSAGQSGAANTGGGGGGAGYSGVSGFGVGGAGGGGGGFIDVIITNPSTTYSYVVGAGGTAGPAGTGGAAGGAGGSGLIEVTEYYY